MQSTKSERVDIPEDEEVLIEAMGFMWLLPWKKVKDDVEKGFATLVRERTK